MSASTWRNVDVGGVQTEWRFHQKCKAGELSCERPNGHLSIASSERGKMRGGYAASGSSLVRRVVGIDSIDRMKQRDNWSMERAPLNEGVDTTLAIEQTSDMLEATTLVPSPPSMDILLGLDDQRGMRRVPNELPHRCRQENVDAAICGNILHSI